MEQNIQRETALLMVEDYQDEARQLPNCTAMLASHHMTHLQVARAMETRLYNAESLITQLAGIIRGMK